MNTKKDTLHQDKIPHLGPLKEKRVEEKITNIPKIATDLRNSKTKILHENCATLQVSTRNMKTPTEVQNCDYHFSI